MKTLRDSRLPSSLHLRSGSARAGAPSCSCWPRPAGVRRRAGNGPKPDPRAARPRRRCSCLPSTTSRPRRTRRPSPCATPRASTRARPPTPSGSPRPRASARSRAPRFPPGPSRTNLTFASALPAGHEPRLVGRGPQAPRPKSRSSTATFRTAAVACGARRRAPTPSPSSTGSCPPATSRTTSTTIRRTCSAHRMAAGSGPNNFFGFLSLGDEGHVTVDMEACAAGSARTRRAGLPVRGPGAGDPLSPRGSPTGPFQLLAYRVLCGTRVPGFPQRRYLRLRPRRGRGPGGAVLQGRGRRALPSARADTPSEGADIDAVEILHLK